MTTIKLNIAATVDVDVNQDGSVRFAAGLTSTEVRKLVEDQYAKTLLSQRYEKATRSRLDEGLVRVSSGRAAGFAYFRLVKIGKVHIVLESAKGTQGKWRLRDGGEVGGDKEFWYSSAIFPEDLVELKKRAPK